MMASVMSSRHLEVEMKATSGPAAKLLLVKTNFPMPLLIPRLIEAEYNVKPLI